MEELKKLVKLIEESGKGSANALINLTESTSLETQLYNLVKAEDHISESKVIEQLYGLQDRISAFKMLKSRVKRKLYNQINFINLNDTKKYSNIIAAEIRCNALLND